MRHCVEARLLKAIGQDSSERSGWFFQRDRDSEEDRWPESFELIPMKVIPPIPLNTTMPTITNT